MNANDLPVAEQIKREVRAEIWGDKSAWERDCQSLRAMIERHGLCNIVGQLAEQCQNDAAAAELASDQANDCGDHTTKFQKLSEGIDFATAAEMLTIAAGGVDLPYGSMPSVIAEQRRAQSVAWFKSRAAAVNA